MAPSCRGNHRDTLQTTRVNNNSLRRATTIKNKPQESIDGTTQKQKYFYTAEEPISEAEGHSMDSLYHTSDKLPTPGIYK